MLLTRRSGDAPLVDEHIDMTAMVDVVFQLMTFLLLTYQASTEAAVEMPVAKYGVGVEETETIVLTVAPPRESGAPAQVFEGLELEPARRLDDNESIRVVVERGLTGGKRRVVIQADGGVSYGEVLRVAAAAGEVQGITVHIGVEEPK